MTDPTGPLAEFICGLKYADLPERVRQRVHLITVDAIANAFAGWQAAETPSIRRLAEKLGGTGISAVIGGTPLALTGAVLLNAYLITAVSACDVYRPALCHITPEVIPPALAMAEQTSTTGEQMLLAVAAGLETTARLGRGLHYSAFRSRGWHSPGVIGPFGGAAAVGKLLGLDAARMQNALGLAGSQASGTFAAFGTAGVKFHQAHGAFAGLAAALLAAENFKTTNSILVHRDGGLFNAMSDGGDPDAVVDDLGERWELENISLRLWPTAAALQSVVSALMMLIERNGLTPRQVRRIDIGLPKAAYDMNGTMGWQDRLSAMLSARYVTSVVLHDRACWLRQFDAAHLADPGLAEFAQSRVEARLDPTIESDGAEVRVVMDDGRELVERRDYPKGDPRDPLSFDEVLSKLQIFGEACLEGDHLDRATESLTRLPKLESVRVLCQQVC